MVGPNSCLSYQILLFACSRPFYSFGIARCIPIVGLCLPGLWSILELIFETGSFSWHFTCDNSAIEKRDRKIELEEMATNKRKRWSKPVTEKSNALDLEQGVFSKADPRSIARSLKRSADRSRRRKSDPFRSAMSMLNTEDRTSLPKHRMRRD
jgi:hypothetical protein